MSTITPPRPPADVDLSGTAAVLATLPPVVRARTPDRQEIVDGRELVTRPWLARVTGEREHTLYKWWVDRANNGHPDGTEIDGVLFFDLEQWRAWRAEHSADRRVVAGRVLLSRAELARRTGEPAKNLQLWWDRRDDNDHPDGVRYGRKLYHDEEQWFTWYRAHREQLKAGLTPVDRSGDPDELVGQSEAARILGYTSSSTIPKYRARGQFVEPDEVGTNGGQEMPLWRRRTLWTFADNRTWSRAPRRRAPSPARVGE